MLQYIISRVVTMFPVLLLISIFVFSIMHLLPGDPATLILQGQNATTPEQVARLRVQLGLNDPVYVQYGRFITGAIFSKGDKRGKGSVFLGLLTGPT